MSNMNITGNVNQGTGSLKSIWPKELSPNSKNTLALRGGFDILDTVAIGSLATGRDPVWGNYPKIGANVMLLGMIQFMAGAMETVIELPEIIDKGFDAKTGTKLLPGIGDMISAYGLLNTLAGTPSLPLVAAGIGIATAGSIAKVILDNK